MYNGRETLDMQADFDAHLSICYRTVVIYLQVDTMTTLSDVVNFYNQQHVVHHTSVFFAV